MSIIIVLKGEEILRNGAEFCVVSYYVCIINITYKYGNTH